MPLESASGRSNALSMGESMASIAAGGISGNLKRIANEVAELPGIRWLAQPLYR